MKLRAHGLSCLDWFSYESNLCDRCITRIASRQVDKSIKIRPPCVRLIPHHLPLPSWLRSTSIENGGRLAATGVASGAASFPRLYRQHLVKRCSAHLVPPLQPGARQERAPHSSQGFVARLRSPIRAADTTEGGEHPWHLWVEEASISSIIGWPF